MTFGGLAAGLAVALLSGLVARFTVVKEDASFAAFYLVSLSLGVVLVSAKGSNLDLIHILFGTVLALDDAALILIGMVAAATLLWLAVAYRPLVIECVDPLFLRLSGRASAITHLSFLAVVVLNLVGGFQALGTLLAVGIMLLPAVIARFWATTLSGLLPVAVGAALASSYAGLLLSYHAELPSGPAIVVTAGGLYLLSVLFGRNGGVVWRIAGRHGPAPA
jgi:zinc/manganese transport system permease protein